MANLIPTSTFDGIVQQTKELESLLTTNPEMERRLRAAVNMALIRARNQMSMQAKSAMASDPRNAYLAVGKSVYKRILGGNINILDRSRRSGATSYEAPRKLRQGQVGGNRIPRSKRTEALQSYQGADRAFILRFVNSGTCTRTSRLGNRGAIAGKNFMTNSVMVAAAEELSGYIEEEYKKMTSNG